MNITSIQHAGDIKGKRVLTRLDLNLPIQDGNVVDDLRVQKSLQTLNYLRDAGAHIVVIAHIEGKGGVSLEPVAENLRLYFPLNFVKDFLNKDVALAAVNEMKDGDMVLFENLRESDGEKNNDPEFAAYLAQFGDIYVNDAFSVSHREHASIIGVPKLLPHFAGFNLIDEIEHIQKVFQPPHPFTFILGGAKFETKIPLIKKFLPRSEHIFIGGALANNFFKEHGLHVGKSLVSEGNFDLAQYKEEARLLLPTDVVVKDSAGVISTKLVNQIKDDEVIMDVGPASIKTLGTVIETSKFILWNGPMGNYEEGFRDQTIAIARIIAETGVEAALGGGDTTAAVASLNLDDDKNIFISTGGGAMLQYLLDETLPGIEALK